MMKIVIAFTVGENHTKPMVARGRTRINRAGHRTYAQTFRNCTAGFDLYCLFGLG
jgi:hypothetical protein